MISMATTPLPAHSGQPPYRYPEMLAQNPGHTSGSIESRVALYYLTGKVCAFVIARSHDEGGGLGIRKDSQDTPG
jgi:hypothetical protein